MDWNNINRDRDTSGLGPIEYDQSKVPQLIRKHADNVRGKSYGQQVREAQARNAEYAGLIASEAKTTADTAHALSKDTQNRFNDQIAGNTDINEVIEARRPEMSDDSYATLNERLNADKDVTKLPIFKKRPTDIDDTERLQRVFDYAFSNDLPVILQGGTYYVHLLNLHPGMTLIGNGAVFKKPNMSIEPYNYSVGNMKWQRLMTCLDYNSDVDSPLTTVDGITFDGNCWDMWTTPDYSQEQASLFIAQASGTKKGRLLLNISNCHFKDNVSDGIHIVNNVVANISNMTSYDCFRGGITITGGYSKINVNNFTSISNLLADGVDVEIDSQGYGGTRAVEINFNNVNIDNDFDVSIPDNSALNVTNLSMSFDKGNFNFGVGFNSTLNVDNSRLVSNGLTANHLLLSGVANFRNCDFIIKGRSDDASTGSGIYVHVYDTANSKGVIGRSWKVNFDTCDFRYLGDNHSTQNNFGIYVISSSVAIITTKNCNYDRSLSGAVRTQGKYFSSTDDRYDCRVYGIYIISNQYNPGSVLLIDNPSILNDTIKYVYVDGSLLEIQHRNTVLTNKNSGIYGSAINTYLESTTYYHTFLGNRLIYTSVDPTTNSVKGIVGDIAISTTPLGGGLTKTWKCVRNSATSSPWYSVWTEITNVNTTAGII